MFAIATKNFVAEVDNRGLLIPVCSLNDTIGLLTVVVKRRRFWFWQKPKYLPTDFIFNDILSGDSPIKPAVAETDFIKYSGTFGDNIQGSVDAGFVKANISAEGKDSSKLQSSFGSLKKEEVDVQKLLQDCKDRVLDMSHCLIQQTREKYKRVFGIVKERIVTTQPCSVIEEVQQGGQCGGSLSSCGPKSHKISLKENGSLSKDSNITMEIPTQTTIAYGLLELEIKQDGRFTLCLMSDTKGSFEVDSAAKKELVGLSGSSLHTFEIGLLQQELEHLKDHFQLLSALPASVRSSLLQKLTELMLDPAAISALQEVLEQKYLEPGVGDIRLTESEKNIQEILDMLVSCPTGQPTSALTALHLIVSALDEMTQDCLEVLRICSNPTALQTLDQLVQCLSGNGEVALSSAELTEDTYTNTKQLFSFSNVSLRKDGNVVRTEIKHPSGNLPVVLCIVIRSLASLVHCC